MTAFILGDTRHWSSPIINPGWAPAQVAAEGVLTAGVTGRRSLQSEKLETLLHRRPRTPCHAHDGTNSLNESWRRNHFQNSAFQIIVVWPHIIHANERLLQALLCTRISYKGPRELNIWGSISAVVGWRQSISPSLFAVWPGAWRAKPLRSSARKRWPAHKTANVSSRSPLSEGEETGLTFILATWRL